LASDKDSSHSPGRQRAGKPPQVPEQQSVTAVQGAPAGAHAARQASLPETLGAQMPGQQSVARAQGRPAARQEPGIAQRELASQVAALSQHSVGFLHASPVALHPGVSAQRSTPSGTVRQVPEQQSSFD
jgi:hypothetical protein